jgi:hypothetical protein
MGMYFYLTGFGRIDLVSVENGIASIQVALRGYDIYSSPGGIEMFKIRNSLIARSQCTEIVEISHDLCILYNIQLQKPIRDLKKFLHSEAGRLFKYTKEEMNNFHVFYAIYRDWAHSIEK